MSPAGEGVYGWGHPETARYYEAFCRRHTRYQEANRALVEAAGIRPGIRVLDLGAGTGRTAEAALPHLGDGEIVAVEPSSAMRREGQRRLPDPRVRWVDDLSDAGEMFDRILWGAGIWQANPLRETLGEIASLVRTGGEFCFTIPGIYLGTPDDPGGGDDPLLLQLPSLLCDGAPLPAPEWTPLPKPDELDLLLQASGLDPARSQFRVRISLEGQRDWLKIPVLTERMMPGVEADDRARRIDAAYARLPRGSWKWEGWYVWTARKVPAW